MGKNVVVFNCYSGDSFIIESEKCNLLVDCGVDKEADYIALLSMSSEDYLKVIGNEILKKKKTYKKFSLLITHFHYDHFAGIVDMYRRGISGEPDFENMFDKIYMADIWKNPYHIISLLLEEKLKRTAVTYDPTLSLFEIFDFLGENAKVVELVSRDSIISNEYRVLWPPEDIDEAEFDSILKSSRASWRILTEELTSVVSDVCDHMSKVLSKQDDTVYSKEKMENDRNRIKEILESHDIEPVSDDEIILLNKLNHVYNIVFHDAVYNDENVLFTGDAETEHMDKIFHEWHDLYSHYKYIKIPHHGTKRHYFDFGLLDNEPEYVIIPNGPKGKMPTGTSLDSYMIYEEYGKIGKNHICTNNCFCGCKPNCIRKNECGGNLLPKKIVYSDPFITI